ncbi:hypothetical protein GQ651_09630 [Alphaproteobacteria bacterium GH1-50]|uniref:Uncharacterized protein n=1 Tax=Kangsaoukella pontilimi TaxID=2691042 RepID=A0A7C9J3D3_9RHOB|nr:hypothetical protein [Kangsaoukella pontilimi]MXQ08101.1 hypothetical protein [Kangsaoukella pontilimi]
MTLSIRDATPDDIPRLADLLLLDAGERAAVDPILWGVADNTRHRVEEELAYALTAEDQPVRQFWQVAEDGDDLLGVVHAMLLPVPPIYKGRFGMPGLILADSYAAPEAPDGTVTALVAAGERALREAGAQVLLSTFVTGEVWRSAFEEAGFAPLTLYLSRNDLGDSGAQAGVRPATEADIPGIVARSAENRHTLFEIEPFWEIHAEADARFAAWMTRSLTLADRDMMVMGTADALDGYAIAQPASRIHFPPAHDVVGTGVIDDYYHVDYADIEHLAGEGQGAMTLLRAAEGALAARGVGAAFVVCPAGWHSKVDLLRRAGYETAMVWSIKR